MATTNHERVGTTLDLLRAGLAPFVEREVMNKAKARAVNMDTIRRFAENPALANKPIVEWDVAGLLKLMWDTWNDVFRDILGFAERSLVSELRGWRNKWAHQERFSSDDTDRALDSAERLLMAVSASQAQEVAKVKRELRRLVFDEQVRSETRRAGGLIEAASAGAFMPWREVAVPHADVASGRYQHAEFAADLWQVHIGEGAGEYRDPEEFFRRTFLTNSLKRILTGAVERLGGRGGDPVVDLQTNFGGGKTHSMLALYHLFSGIAPERLAGIEDVLSDASAKTVGNVRRVVLVGNRLSPGNPTIKPDGTVIRTLWGELAYQVGGRPAFERVRADDEHATSPGDVLRELLVEYGPCLVLIDEWVSYARQLHEDSDLPGGSFETQFTFAQALTESIKNAGNCLLVVSLPASHEPNTEADDAEVGGIRGRDALARLRNVVARVESSSVPASAEEGFEIVRRRLFEPLAGQMFKHRDVTARAYAELYRTQSVEFPSECRTIDYERRIQAAYPIHPEVFDRLYSDWSALATFQRTRGVLRLMAAVIHCLWERGDKNSLILPSTIPIDDDRVRNELTRYLPENWTRVIDTDVDGPNALPLKIDSGAPNLGKLSATRRVARTVYLGSAPSTAAAHRGIDDGLVKLGCVAPGESPAVFGDALRRLAASATYLYQDGGRVWYATQPTVIKLAEDRAEQYKRDPDLAAKELDRRLRANLRARGDFAAVHALPSSGGDVSDDLDARLVVLPADKAHARDSDDAITVAQGILESRGNTPRLYRNTVVFLAADKVRYQDLDEALRRYLAWQSIVGEKDELNLDPHQTRQAETQRAATDDTVAARLPETYQWLLVPDQPQPDSPVEWKTFRLTGSGALAERASRRLRSDELLVTAFHGSILRYHMDQVPLWRGNHVEVRQLVDDFAKYAYLPRLGGPDVLLKAIEAGATSTAWRIDGFALAEAYDEAAGRYRGLRELGGIDISLESSVLLVKPDVAGLQLDAERTEPTPRPDGGTKGTTATEGVVDGGAHDETTEPPGEAVAEAKPRRFHGAVNLDPTRVGRDAGEIAEEVLAHLSGLVNASVRVTLEVDADIPEGAPEHVVRTVTENSRTLKFDSHGFEDS